MKLDLPGKIRNTPLPRSKAILPMFEAVVNSLQAIEDAGGAAATPRIEILVIRDTVLPGADFVGKVDGFTIIDNGIGFDDTNLDSFFTSDTQYKVGRGGKGLGRFLWLKAFQFAEIESHFRQDGKFFKRAFKFTMTGDEPGPPAVSPAKAPTTTVYLKSMKLPYKDACPQSLGLIGHLLIEHCLPFFLDPKCPSVTISDDFQKVDLNHYFRETFASKATNHTFKVQDSAFTLRGLRLFNPHEMQHRLLYAANYREVLAEKLDKFLPNLQKKRLTDGDGNKFVYLGFVEGEYLDQNVNSERIGFTFPLDRSGESAFDEITLEGIRSAAMECVSLDLKPFLEEINTEKRAKINSYIA